MNPIRTLSALSLLLVIAGCLPPAQSGDAPALGVADTPRNFPRHTPKEVDDAFTLSRDVGDWAVFIYQWGEFDPAVARLMADKCRRTGLKPVFGLSPTSLDRDRKELDLPAGVRRRAGAKISFANPVIREAFTRAAGELAALKPPYLCLATEINFLAIHNLSEFLHFATLYKETYRAVKRISPSTKVFVSFQWEWVRIIDSKEMHKLREHSKVFDIFRPQLDAVGLTTYPAPFHGTPAELPDDYYTWAHRHIRRSDEVLFMEAGWPTSGPGNEAEQAAYIRRLPQLLRGLRTSVVAWALLHDVKLSAFGADLNSVGLLDRTGRPKTGLAAFKELKTQWR
jgi:hypothetical protein